MTSEWTLGPGLQVADDDLLNPFHPDHQWLARPGPVDSSRRRLTGLPNHLFVVDNHVPPGLDLRGGRPNGVIPHDMAPQHPG